MSPPDRLLKLRFVAGTDPGCVFRLTLNAWYLDLSGGSSAKPMEF